MHDERLTLASLCGGAVQEKVDRALEKVAKNILDPNTDPDKKRTITLKITLKPDENDNEDVKVNADVSYTLAPEIGVQTRFFVSRDIRDDRVIVMEHKKGEIKGQLDFNDIGMVSGTANGSQQPSVQGDKVDDVEAGGSVVDVEPRETIKSENSHEILDFRKQG